MTLPESIFNESLDKLQKGESLQSIANDFPEYKQELESLLSVAEVAISIPKITPPTPIKRQLFLEARTQSYRFMEIFQFARVAIIPISLVIALLGGRAAVDATENSLPGDKLYSVKRATEEARLTLTRDSEKVATLHVELMQKRLNEVKQAADSGNEETEAAAIAELKSQADETFAVVPAVATANAITKSDSSLLDTLVAVNKEQKTVLFELSETGETDNAKTIATTALENNKKNDQTLAKIIATVNDQTLVDLPNKISVTGTISSVGTAYITVEKNTFKFDDKTSVTGIDGEPISDLQTLVGKVTVTGTRNEDGVLIAKQILMLPEETTPVVKGTSTTKPSTQQPTVEPEPTTPPDEQQPTSETEQKASGGFIAEPSTQQYFQ